MMTLGGWISMTTSLAIVIGLFGWCAWQLVKTRNTPNETEEPREEETGNK